MRQRDIDRVTIDRQRALLVEKDERIAALEVELEATQVAVEAPADVRYEFLLERARWYRALARFYKAQAELGFTILRNRTP